MLFLDIVNFLMGFSMFSMLAFYRYFDHFFIHCKRYMTDSTSSCPLPVNLYSTRGGTSLYAFLSRMPPFSSSLRRLASVLLLMPLSACRNCLYLTGSVVQHSGIRISS